MKTIGVRALRENPGVLSSAARDGEFVLITNRSDPVSLSVPFSGDLLSAGAHVNIAAKLYEDSALTLVKAAKLARMSVEEFMRMLNTLNAVSIDYSEDELSAELDMLDTALSKDSITTNE